VIFNILENISPGNLEDKLIAQNPDLNLKKGDIKVKLSYETKKHIWNLVMESDFGGLEVACWPLEPKFLGSNPAETVGFFRAKNSKRASLREGK
jgi:hypothetical protein